MEGMGGSQLRAARAALFAALCVTLSATSHVLMSADPLPLATVAGAYGAVFALAYALAGRERGFWSIAGLLVPLELGVDTLFTTGQQTCYGPGGGPVTGSWRALMCGGRDVGTSLSAVPGTHAPDAAPWLLLAAHVAVGLLASWWLRRGEAGLHRLLSAAVAVVFRPPLTAVAAVTGTVRRPPAGPARTREDAAAPGLPLLHSVVRRGPPRRSTA